MGTGDHVANSTRAISCNLQFSPHTVLQCVTKLVIDIVQGSVAGPNTA